MRKEIYEEMLRLGYSSDDAWQQIAEMTFSEDEDEEDDDEDEE